MEVVTKRRRSRGLEGRFGILRIPAGILGASRCVSRGISGRPGSVRYVNRG